MSPSFMMSALDGGESSPSRSCRFTHEETALGTHWIGDQFERYGENKNRTPTPRMSGP
jgi:hypothetical protein